MIRNLGLALTTALACTYATGASAAEMAVMDAGTTEATEATAEAVDPSAYRVTGVAASSLAAAQSTSSGGSGWEFAVTPYLWATGAKADIKTPRGEEAQVDESFFDVLGDLKFAFMGTFDARHGRFVTVQDVIYLSLGSSADGHIGPIPVDAEVDEKLLATSHLVGYRVVDKGPMFLDLMAGARIGTLKVDLKLKGPLQEIKRDSSQTRIGPMIASRFRMPLGGKWAAMIYGDVGGYGVTEATSWELLGVIQYDISDQWRLHGGWRHFSGHIEKNDFDIDVKLDGPILGVSYRF